MGMALGGKLYTNGVIPFDTNTEIDCGFGYTGDELASSKLTLHKVQHVQDLLTPNYYYTDTDTLSDIGYKAYLKRILSIDTSADKKTTLPVLIHVPDNYVLINSDTSAIFVQLLFMLKYFSLLSTEDKKNPTLNQAMFDHLEQKALPFLPEQVKNLTFYSDKNEKVSLTFDWFLRYEKIKYCKYKSPNTGEEYPINFYTRSDGVICDMYIGGYHMQLLTYSNNKNDATASSAVYVSACDEKDFCNKFWFSLNALQGIKKSTFPDDNTNNQYGYDFGVDTNGNTLRWDTSTQTRVIGELATDTYIRYYKPDDTGMSFTNSTALNFDPDIFNIIGYSGKNINTVGTLPAGTNLTEVGIDGFYSGYTTPLAYANNNSNNLYAFPLGDYLLYPNFSYSNVPASGVSYTFLKVYSYDGYHINQEVLVLSPTSYTYVTYKRVLYMKDGIVYSNDWSYGEWV